MIVWYNIFSIKKRSMIIKTKTKNEDEKIFNSITFTVT